MIDLCILNSDMAPMHVGVGEAFAAFSYHRLGCGVLNYNVRCDTHTL